MTSTVTLAFRAVSHTSRSYDNERVWILDSTEVGTHFRAESRDSEDMAAVDFVAGTPVPARLVDAKNRTDFRRTLEYDYRKYDIVVY